MKNYSNDNTARRYTAHVSVLGTSQIHLRKPYIIAWWSAAFPGFGHLLLSKYIRGFLLFMWEFIVNVNTNLNVAIIYSFQGDIAQAIQVVDPKWLLMYTPVYFFGIWDSYRTTVDLNKVFILAEQEEHAICPLTINELEINYLDKRNPIMALLWSLFIPVLGQLYLHQILKAFAGISSTTLIFYKSNVLEAVTLLLLGEIQQATAVVDPEWLLFLPSIYGFFVYDAYINAVENNKLFEKEQRQFLQKNYQSPNFRILSKEKVM